MKCIISLLAFTTAFCQSHRYHQLPKIVDTNLRQQLPHRIYRFDGIVRKPWTFYKVINGGLKQLPDNDQVSNKTKHWDKFILTVRDITVDCLSDSANVTIIYNKGKSHYLLKKSTPNKYIFKNDTVNLMLIAKSSLICEFYFIKDIEAASVSNMDWEMANKL